MVCLEENRSFERGIMRQPIRKRKGGAPDGTENASQFNRLAVPGLSCLQEFLPRASVLERGDEWSAFTAFGPHVSPAKSNV